MYLPPWYNLRGARGIFVEGECIKQPRCGVDCRLCSTPKDKLASELRLASRAIHGPLLLHAVGRLLCLDAK